MTQQGRLVAAVAALLLCACRSTAFDPVPGIGAGLKNLCRSQDNCSVHEAEPPRH